MVKHLTVEEVAGDLKVSKRTILREIKRGNLHPEKVGRRYLVSKKELQRYLHKEEASLETSISSYFKERKAKMVNLLQKLVSLPSVGYEIGQEQDSAEYLINVLEGYGIRARIIKEKNTVAVHGSFGYADKGILLNCPLDTTPVGDVNKWKYPPFGGTIKAGKMYGRGTADSKAGMVSMIFAVLALKEFVNEEDIRVELVFDGGEQDGTYRGMKAVLKHGLYVNAGIIGYANDDFELPIGARGYHRYKLTTKGQSSHTGSRNRTGINAIEKMTDLIALIKKKGLANKKEKYFEFGNRITFSMIEGGRAINIVPDECFAKLDVRTTPAYSKTDVDDLIQSAINELKRNDKEFDVEVKYLVGSEGYVLDKNEDIVRVTRHATKQVHRVDPPLVATGPAHIGNLLIQNKVPVIISGPIGGNVHSYDEYIEIDSLPKASEVYFMVVKDYFSG